MQYHSVLNSVERGVVAPVYLIFGEEEYLQELVITALKNKLTNTELGAFNLEEMEGSGLTAAQVVNSANTLPVFADKRLVIVKNPPFFQGRRKDGEEETAARQDEQLLAYLADPLISTCLVFWVKGSVDKRRKTYKAIEKNSQVVEIGALKGAELTNWLQNAFKALGKRVEPKALEYIILNSSHNLRHLQNELDKLTLFVDREEIITLTTVKKVLTRTAEANVFALVDYLGTKEGEKALVELRGLLESGEPPVRLLFMIARQFRLLLLAKDLESRGYTEKQITAELALHPFVTGKILRQAKNFTFRELEHCLAAVLTTDVAVKTGSIPRLALENLVLQLAIDAADVTAKKV